MITIKMDTFIEGMKVEEIIRLKQIRRIIRLYNYNHRVVISDNVVNELSKLVLNNCDTRDSLIKVLSSNSDRKLQIEEFEATLTPKSIDQSSMEYAAINPGSVLGCVIYGLLNC